MVENKVQLPCAPSTEAPAEGIQSMIGGKDVDSKQDAQKQQEKEAVKEQSLELLFL
jgi:hypothetical protein